MSVRDEAARAMVKAPFGASFAQYVDAIPDDVLVRLAIERGALVDAGENAEGDAWREGFTLYKVVAS